jgi:hypothetical protein
VRGSPFQWLPVCRFRPGALSAAAVVILLPIVTGSCDSGAPTGPTEAECLGADVPSPLRGVAPRYAGPLYDTHVHLDELALGGRMGCRLLEQGVERAVVFVRVDPARVTGTERDWSRALQGFPDRWVPFFHVDPKAPWDMAPERIRAVLDAGSGTYRGVGEVALYHPVWSSTGLGDPPLPQLAELLEGRNLWLMIHLRPGMETELSAFLEAYPGLRVLIHAFDNPAALPGLLQGHPNLHVTIDTSILLREEVPGAPGLWRSLMFWGGGAELDRERLRKAVDEHWETHLQKVVQEWLPTIEAAPDRVFWGSDAAFPWHVEPEIYARLADFSRAFVASLPAGLRDGFAHGNARRLLGGGVPLP